MGTFRRVVFAAAAAGLIAGVFVSVLHIVGMAPLIAEAERYEKAPEPAPTPSAHAAAVSQEISASPLAHDDEDSGWAPKQGFERAAFTVLADVVTAIGFALLLVAAYALRGTAMDWRKGLAWGLAGFATFTLAPALGLPPELPGTEAAPLLDRQVWWIATAVATGSGLAMLFLARRSIWIVAGVALLVLPHLVGAPQPGEYKSLAPDSLSHKFIATVLTTSFLFWLVLGALSGFFYSRFRPAL